MRHDYYYYNKEELLRDPKIQLIVMDDNQQVFKSRTASTALKALEQGKANKLLYLKGDTKGGTVGNVQTLPIYLLEQYHF